VEQAEARKLHDQRRTDPAAQWGLLLLLVAMTSIGPTSLNILVPAIPQLARTLAGDVATLQFTVSLFLIGLAGAQLVMGPLSDRFGRRPVLLGGMALTALASILAIVMSTVESLIVARMLQAIGASTGIVVGRAIIRDLFDRSRAASMLGLVATVMVVVPTFGPLIGGVLDTAFGWQAIFIFTAATSLVVLVWIAVTLPETRGLNAPSDDMSAGFWRDLRWLANSPSFTGYVLVGALGSSTFFAFLGGGPHVVITLMERSSAEYGIWFAISSLGYMAGNFAASRLALQHGIDTLIWWGIGIEAIGVASATVLAAFAHDWGPVIIFGPQMLISLGNGLLLPGAISGAVSVRPPAAGTAAGITGCTQMAVGAAVTQYAGTLLAHASSALPMAVLMDALIAGCAVGFALLVRRR
jgi:MFS transporter, DHA1 family, multidrug resistance protein